MARLGERPGRGLLKSKSVGGSGVGPSFGDGPGPTSSVKHKHGWDCSAVEQFVCHPVTRHIAQQLHSLLRRFVVSGVLCEKIVVRDFVLKLLPQPPVLPMRRLPCMPACCPSH